MTTRTFNRIAVFCGSNVGRGDAYIDAAGRLGAEIAKREIAIVFGGTHKGLMGSLADAALEIDGRVHGIITERLAGLGHLHPRLTDHEVVPDMHARKARMAEMADAFIALPGGIGTTEEFVEAWTLNQLGYFDKPVGLLDVAGYFQPFLAFVDRMVEQKFLPESHRHGVIVNADPATLLDGLLASSPVTEPKWL
jgi:uncharacterized protein (TIGR00730 family)